MSTAVLQVVILLAVSSSCEPLEVLSQPTDYITFQSNTFTEGGYNVDQGIGSCVSSREEVDGTDRTVITCPQGELLTDGIRQTNLGFRLTDTEVQTFYTWREGLLPVRDAFITLRFLDGPIVPTRVEVYCLILLDLRIQAPQNIRLFLSNINSVFPEAEITGVDSSVFTVVNSGRIIISRRNADDDDDDDDDDDVTRSYFEYRKYTLTIPENERNLSKYLRTSLDFEGDNWIFINEVEIYHDNESSLIDPTTTAVAATATTMTILPSTTTVLATTMTFLPSTTTVLATTMTFLPSTTTVLPPSFVFPTVNPYTLHVTVIPSNLTINCTVTWEEDLTTTWSYNGVNISTSNKYTVTISQLAIRGFTQDDIGVYQCTVQHTSGWQGSRKYFIAINQEKINTPEPVLPQEPTSSKNSANVRLYLVVVIAAGGVISIIFCIIVVICCVMCYRRKRKQKNLSSNPVAYPTYKNSESNLVTYEENRYEKIDSAKIYSAASAGTSTTPIYAKPMKPPPPEENKSINKYYYISDSQLNASNPMYGTNSVAELDIYDDVLSASPPSTSRHLQESIYCEAFDYSKQDSDDDPYIYGSMNMCMPMYDDLGPLTKSEAPRLIEWNSIDVKEKIGEGQFGEVYLAEVNGIDAAEIGCEETSKILVAIKTLKGDHTASLKQQFEKEIKFMARLDNANVIKLLGICNKGKLFIMTEYMRNGDLHMFLRKHYHPTIGKVSGGAKTQVDIPILLYMAQQIANGMRYLASHGFIHRDLAARNCLVGEDHIVKVADFGMTQDLYNSSYFCIRGTAAVPIRWMASECFFGRFSTKTDVWSYGVTLWEIFMLCQQQPYEEMSDEELIFDVQKGPNRTLLQRPPIAPDEVYSVMTRCWRHTSAQRPDFESLYKQLLEFDKTLY